MNKEFFKLGIIGNPLKHSISPLIQKAALDSANLSGSYEKFEISENDIEKQIKYFIKNNYTGFNITIPYKIDIIKYLDEIDDEAAKIGAVNTVKINKNGKLKGFNTDIFGFVNSIPEEHQNIKNATMLGCGGAALAVVFGLDSLGCKNIRIGARNHDKAADFINALKDKTGMTFSVSSLDDINSLENTDILINATPLGTLGENENKMPVNKNIFENSNKDTYIFDLVYNPEETLLIKTARDFGFNYTNGLNMLILQGAKAFEIWTKIYPDIYKMKNAYKKH